MSKKVKRHEELLKDQEDLHLLLLKEMEDYYKEQLISVGLIVFASTSILLLVVFNLWFIRG